MESAPVRLEQHQREIQRNKEGWERKPLLRRLYGGFYGELMQHIDAARPGRVLEIGSGIGNLKRHLPGAITTDLFLNPWLDLVCDGYELPFQDKTISHLVLFDVFHHLEAPAAFFKEAERVLASGGRVLVFDPFISWLSWPVYGLLHHEPVGWRWRINPADQAGRSRGYYAAQGNATRVFFSDAPPSWLRKWRVGHREVLPCWSYLLSGGFSKQAVYPERCLNLLRGVESVLGLFPRWFGARCLVVLERENEREEGEEGRRTED